MVSPLSKVLIGTSGWHYKDWNGVFYPSEIKGPKQLSFYAQSFPTTENNSSFYHMPLASTLQKWYTSTPKNFIFSLKLNRSLTHIYRLIIKKESKAKLIDFLNVTQSLKEKLGVILIQLPGNFKYNLDRLEEFLNSYQKGISKQPYQPRTSIEFRDPGWFTNETYALLKKNNIALTIAQSALYPCEKVLTTDFLYLRFHGPAKLFMSRYTAQDLKEWAIFIKLSLKKIKKVYIYFNNDYYGNAIDNARELKRLLEGK